MKFPYVIVDSVEAVLVVSEATLVPGFVLLYALPESESDAERHIITFTQRYKLIYNDYPRHSREEMIVSMAAIALDIFERAELSRSLMLAMQTLRGSFRLPCLLREEFQGAANAPLSPPREASQ